MLTLCHPEILEIIIITWHAQTSKAGWCSWLQSAVFLIFLFSIGSSCPAVVADDCCPLVWWLMSNLTRFVVAQCVWYAAQTVHIQFKVGLVGRVIDLSIISLSTLYRWKILYWHNDCLQTMMVMNVDAAVLAVSFPQCKNKKCLTSFLWSPLVLAGVHSKVTPHWILINASCCFWDQ